MKGKKYNHIRIALYPSKASILHSWYLPFFKNTYNYFYDNDTVVLSQHQDPVQLVHKHILKEKSPASRASSLNTQDRHRVQNRGTEGEEILYLISYPAGTDP